MLRGPLTTWQSSSLTPAHTAIGTVEYIRACDFSSPEFLQSQPDFFTNLLLSASGQTLKDSALDMLYRRAIYNQPWQQGSNRRLAPRRNEDALKVSQSVLSKHMHDLRALGSWIRGSDHPAPEESAILALVDPKRKPASVSPPINRYEAFGLMHQALKEKITTAACLDSSKKNKYQRIFLPYMVFNDLDKALFRSTLEGNVYLKWSAGDSLSICSRPGLHGRPRITIELSSRLTYGTRADILGTLLHQMIHAYLLQVCGHRNTGVDSDGHDLGHEHDFLAVQHSVRKYFLPGEESTVHS